MWLAAVCLAATVFAAANAGAQGLQSSEESLGPFALEGQTVTVVLRILASLGVEPPDPDFGRTVAVVSIRDHTGSELYRRELPYVREGNRFRESVDVGAQVLKGTAGTGLLLTYSTLPSAPLCGNAWQVFGIIQGRLAPFGKPFTATGELAVTERPRDALLVRLWTTHYFLLVPLHLDWTRGALAPDPRCLKPSSQCSFRVEAHRMPAETETVAQLYPAPRAIQPRRISVRPESIMEFLEAQASLVWREGEDPTTLDVGQDPWLRVRIDGAEGWIHGEADLTAIGLPPAG